MKDYKSLKDLVFATLLNIKFFVLGLSAFIRFYLRPIKGFGFKKISFTPLR